ncbi:orexigenic neuropeptide QRFP [Erythrolamprus reginae]|uniref:orexigenic neuropeptide QRFP n=1 Tax=Erythrolamprus reginae TaxID=121349 RepID=UPI00396CBAC2
MISPSHLSCLLLLSVGTSSPAHSLPPPKHPGEEFQLVPNKLGFQEAGLIKWRRSHADLNPLFSIAKELQSFGKEKAGIQFRFGRQGMDENPGAAPELPEEDGEKEANGLDSFAERQNGYYDGEKTGFSVWLGRRKREAFLCRR